MLDARIIEHIAQELSLTPQQVTAVIQLLDGGATIPFIARYRKDVIGNLNEAQLETLSERNNYFIGVMSRRAAVTDAIDKLGQLTDELREKIVNAMDKQTIEDIYLPFKPKRRTKATIAEEQGLAPLADFIMKQLPGLGSIQEYIGAFVKPEKSISSPEEALEGACYILAEQFATAPELRRAIREHMMREGKITARPTKNAENTKTKYESYYEFSEPVNKIPSHRVLAILRGVKEGFLRIDIAIDDEALFEQLLAPYVKDAGSMFEPAIRVALREAYMRHLRPGLETEVMESLRKSAEEEAVRVFRQNAENLLLSSPAGHIRIMGVVPMAKRGCKVAVVDTNGAVLEYQTFLLDGADNAPEAAEQAIIELMARHETYAIVIGNSAGSADVTRFVKKVLGKVGKPDAFALTVNAGPASGYATSRDGKEEFEDLEPQVREAVFLARMVQDPLAELVKVEPRSIGVGQYQHDVNQKLLRDGLHKTIVSCVNRVGVNVNTASVALLRYVSGIQMGTAQNIVAMREKDNGFKNRQQLLEVDGIGPKVFEQCAGFLRITNGENPIDATAIHPEAYSLVEQIAQTQNIDIAALFRNTEALEKVDFDTLKTDSIGTFTFSDIRYELLHPGRDVRRPFKAPKLVEGIASLDDLQEGMDVEGVVTNVTDFGAFVDIGMQQDGLVHLSELSKRFVKDPREIIHVGDVVKVRVIKVDKSIPRISLSIKVLQPDPKPRPKRTPRPQVPRVTTPITPSEEGTGTPEATTVGSSEDSGRRPERRAYAETGEGASRRRREEPRRHGESGEGSQQRRRRPASEDQDRRQRVHADSEGMERRGPRPPRKQDRGGAKPQSYGDEGRLSNTLLADQLALLRDKLGSGS